MLATVKKSGSENEARLNQPAHVLAEQLRAAVDLQFAVNVLHVRANGEGRQIEARGNFLIAQPVHDALLYLPFAWGEQIGVRGGRGAEVREHFAADVAAHGRTAAGHFQHAGFELV